MDWHGHLWWLAFMGGAVLVTATVSRRRLRQAALLYLAAPLIVFVGRSLWELAMSPVAD